MGEHGDGSIWHDKVAYLMVTRKQREKNGKDRGVTSVPFK